MTDIILHHYEISPYSEKVRLGLGLKGLAWGSVEIPVIMPTVSTSAKGTFAVLSTGSTPDAHAQRAFGRHRLLLGARHSSDASSLSS